MSSKFIAFLTVIIVIFISICAFFYHDTKKERGSDSNATPLKRPTTISGKNSTKPKLSGGSKRIGPRTIEQDSNLEVSLKRLESLEIGSEERNFLVLEIARRLGDKDPEFGFKWLKSLGEFQEGIRAHRAFASAYAASRPTSWFKDIPGDASEACRKEFISGALVGVVNYDPFMALEQADSLLKEGKIGNVTKEATINSILLSDENSGWSIIANSDGKSGISADEVTRYLSFVRYDDPIRIAERILSLEDPTLQSSAWEIASKNAPEVAISKMADSLLANHSASSANVGFAYLAQRYYRTDPIKAAEWCSKITDQKLFEETKSSIKNYASSQNKDVSRLIIEKLDR